MMYLKFLLGLSILFIGGCHGGYLSRKSAQTSNLGARAPASSPAHNSRGYSDEEKIKQAKIAARRAVIAKIYECKSKCESVIGDKVECGVNGAWYISSCQRDCEGVKVSTNKDKECGMTDKAPYEHYLNCQVKCRNNVTEEACGEDGDWYGSKCWMECNGVKAVDDKLCKKMDKIADCQQKCTKEDYNPVCGEDGQFYASACSLQCYEVKSGTEGRECPSRMNLQKYWGCKEQCSEQQKQEQCGKSGYYFYNQCHMQCYGDNPGQPGKDCDN